MAHRVGVGSNGGRHEGGKDMRARIIGLAAGVVAAVGLAAGPAGAAGPPVERFDGIYGQCTGFGDVFVVDLPSEQDLVPAFVLGTRYVLVPTSVREVMTFTGNDGSVQTQVRDRSRATNRHGTRTTCTAHGEFPTPDGSVSIDLTATAIVVG